jgi:hypothetical protein
MHDKDTWFEILGEGLRKRLAVAEDSAVKDAMQHLLDELKKRETQYLRDKPMQPKSPEPQ